MVRKLSNPETKGVKAKEKPRKVLTKEKAVQETRESVKILALMEKFSNSDIGREFLETYGLEPENIDAIFNDEDVLYPFVATLGAVPHRDMLKGAIPFFRLLAIKNPAFYQVCLNDPDLDPELKERLSKN